MGGASAASRNMTSKRRLTSPVVVEDRVVLPAADEAPSPVEEFNTKKRSSSVPWRDSVAVAPSG